MLNTIMDCLGLILILLGLIVFLFEIVGVIKYKYLLNRMHAAGMGDTLAIVLTLLGVILINGFDFTAAKLVLVVLFFWFTSPTSSHLISKLEALTNDELGENVKVQVDNYKEYLKENTEKEDE